MYKKIIALVSVMAIGLSLTACKSNKPTTVDGKPTAETKIEIGEVKPGQPEVSTNQQKVEDSEKKTEISKTLLNMYAGGENALTSVVTSNGGTIEKSENGIYILTNKVSQREAIINELDKNNKSIVDSFKNKGENFNINYSFQYGYIDVYCTKNEANSLKNDISTLIANVACGQRLLDNTKPWGVSITINEAIDGKSVAQIEVSDEVAFEFSASDWDGSSVINMNPTSSEPIPEPSASISNDTDIQENEAQNGTTETNQN